MPIWRASPRLWSHTRGCGVRTQQKPRVRRALLLPRDYPALHTFQRVKDFLTDLINLKCPATDARFDHLARADNKEAYINSAGREAESAEELLARRLA